MPLNGKIMQGIARKAGLTESEVKSISPERLRQHLTKKTGKKFRVISAFPVIGRGTAMRDFLGDSAEIDKGIDSIV